MIVQYAMDGIDVRERRPPSTRYQGSKYKLLPWISQSIADLGFITALDAFGGTGSVAYMLKAKGKSVVYNDFLRFNHMIGKAIVENSHTTLSDGEVDTLLAPTPHVHYDDFIARTFQEVYFTDEENAWLDIVCQNIAAMPDGCKQAIAFYALFQACTVKRPYNLFHRKNLYMRTADVGRTFGNKATWDKPFGEHFRSFVAEANRAVFDSGATCQATCSDALEAEGNYDLVYIDTPYVSGKAIGVDYHDFYHFLEGAVDYANWGARIDYSRRHRPLKGRKSLWSDARTVTGAFRSLFQRYADSILVVSYRSDGIPSEAKLVDLLQEVKSRVSVRHFGEYKYALSTNGNTKELLLIGQ